MKKSTMRHQSPFSSLEKKHSFLEGHHALREALRTKNARLLFIRIDNARTEELKKIAREAAIPIQSISPQEYPECPSEAFCILETQEYQSPQAWIEKLSMQKKALVLLLNGITDTHNLGAILRSSDQFGVDLVVTQKNRSASPAAALRISSGAGFYVPQLQLPQLARFIRQLQEAHFWIYSTGIKGKAPWDEVFPTHTALIIGDEHNGVQEQLHKLADIALYIPTQGHIDSLNVSVATGILLYEVQRQHHRSQP